MRLSESKCERIATALAWLAVVGGAAMAVFLMWFALWVGYMLGFKM